MRINDYGKFIRSTVAEFFGVRMTRAGMRFRCSALLLLPPAIVWAAPLVGAGRAGQQGSWLSLANGVFVALALFMLTAPFVLPLFMRGSREQLDAVGIDLDQLTMLLGSSIADPYPWAGLSFLGVAFWCWRLRHLLR